MTIEHLLGARRHGEREHKEQGHRDRADGDGDGVNDDVAAGVEPIDSEDNYRADHGDEKEEDKELGELLLEWGADCEAEEFAEPVDDWREDGPVDGGPRRAGTLLVIPPRATAIDGAGDEPDLGKHTRREDDASTAPLGDGRRAEDDIEPVSWPCVIVKDVSGHLKHRRRLPSQHRLVRLQVDGLCEPDVSGNGVADCQVHDVAGDDL